MDSTKIYRIEESNGRSKIVVAEREIYPGELVAMEKEPILYFSDEFLSQYDARGFGLESSMATISTFNKVLSSAEKEKYMTLFGPITGKAADNLRGFARSMKKQCTDDEDKFRSLTDDEVEIFVKVAQISRLNMFGTEDKGHAVFAEITRFAHSCAANCYYSVRGKQIFCFARRFIAAEEELTISYFNERDLEPTHERRFKYLKAKEFTCHCPRCDAPGDDTRQFDCIDPACKGVMMVCQPINQKPIPGDVCSYTGVEYVEPHLLPCTVCHRAAPADNQTEMLALEANMLELGPRLAQRFSDMTHAGHYHAMEDFLKEQQAIKIPRRHAAALPFFMTEMRTMHSLFLFRGVEVTSALQAAVSEYITVLERIFSYPSVNLAKGLYFVSTLCTTYHRAPVFPPQHEKDWAGKALRMHLLLHGRDNRDAMLDRMMNKCHEKVTSALSTEVCAFCEESPQRAALTLSRCGRCRQVAYCSVGCQKAHWKLHKKTCKK